MLCIATLPCFAALAGAELASFRWLDLALSASGWLKQPCNLSLFLGCCTCLLRVHACLALVRRTGRLSKFAESAGTEHQLHTCVQQLAPIQTRWHHNSCKIAWCVTIHMSFPQIDSCLVTGCGTSFVGRRGVKNLLRSQDSACFAACAIKSCAHNRKVTKERRHLGVNKTVNKCRYATSLQNS